MPSLTVVLFPLFKKGLASRCVHRMCLSRCAHAPAQSGEDCRPLRGVEAEGSVGVRLRLRCAAPAYQRSDLFSQPHPVPHRLPCPALFPASTVVFKGLPLEEQQPAAAMPLFRNETALLVRFATDLDEVMVAKLQTLVRSRACSLQQSRLDPPSPGRLPSRNHEQGQRAVCAALDQRVAHVGGRSGAAHVLAHGARGARCPGTDPRHVGEHGAAEFAHQHPRPQAFVQALAKEEQLMGNSVRALWSRTLAYAAAPRRAGLHPDIAGLDADGH
jgi:hypothetical protein